LACVILLQRWYYLALVCTTEEAVQFKAQAPGPRGSPQVPQGVIASRGVSVPLRLLTAKTDSCFSSFLL
ncbi:MAG TPA: hypothetical protein VKK81_06885, partial [Candidatus Binatia bacterium]|nr:hypothetical protein [Candidatus Binatia bacterium]